MGDDDRRDAAPLDLPAEQVHHLLSQFRVERRRRFVDEHQRRIVHQGPPDRDSLLLTARELRRQAVAPSPEAELVEQLIGPLLGLGVDSGSPELADDEQILLRGQERDQVDGLKDEADLIPSEPRQLLVIEFGDVGPADSHAARCRAEQRSCDGQQRGLPRPRRTDEDHHLVVLDGQADVVQRDDLLIIGSVDLADVVEFKCWHWSSNRFGRVDTEHSAQSEQASEQCAQQDAARSLHQAGRHQSDG